jgi:hypothetical protein
MTNQIYEPNIDVTPWNKRLILITPENISIALERLNEWLLSGKIDGACLSNFRNTDLSFIAQYPNCTSLEIKNCCSVQLPLFSELQNLKNLGLSVESPKNPFDVSALTQLEMLYGSWGKGVVGMEKLNKLSFVKLHSCKTNDVSELGLPTSIQHLHLVLGNFVNLTGITALKNLSKFRVNGLSKLNSIADISTLKMLTEVDFEATKKIDDFHSLSSCVGIEKLGILNCGSIKSISWLSSLTKLEALSLYGVNIEDGDLSYVLKLPVLKYFGADNRKHYQPKFSVIEDVVKSKSAAI